MSDNSNTYQTTGTDFVSALPEHPRPWSVGHHFSDASTIRDARGDTVIDLHNTSLPRRETRLARLIVAAVNLVSSPRHDEPDRPDGTRDIMFDLDDLWPRLAGPDADKVPLGEVAGVLLLAGNEIVRLRKAVEGNCPKIPDSSPVITGPIDTEEWARLNKPTRNLRRVDLPGGGVAWTDDEPINEA